MTQSQEQPQEETQEPSQQPAPERIECRASSDRAVRNFIMAALFVGGGVYCIVDRQETVDWYNINSASKYLLNYAPFLFFPIAAIIAIWTIRFRSRVLVADAEGIGYSGAAKIAWNRIEELDATRLDKGYLDLYYGEDQKLVLDSDKLQNYKSLVAFVEKHVPKEKQNV